MSQIDVMKSVRKTWGFSPTTRVHSKGGFKPKFTKSDRHGWKKNID